MEKEPDIIKELRQAEKLGKLKMVPKEQIIFKNNNENYNSNNNILQYIDDPFKRVEEYVEADNLKENYRSIFENCFVAITVADEKERIISWNKYAEELFQMGEKDLFLKNVSTLYPPGEWQKIRSENIRQKGLKNKIETKMLLKSGETIDVEISLCILKGSLGKPVGSIAIIKDISKLKTTEKKYLDFFETAIDPIVIIDKNGRFLDLNKQVTKLLGYEKKELIGKKFDEINILTKDSLEKALNAFFKRLKGQDVGIYEVETVTKNGEIIPAEINANLIYENNKVIGEMVILRDLRERIKTKQMEKELLNSEMRFSDIFDNTSDFLLYLEKGIILDANKTALNITGLKKQDLIGKHFSEIAGIFTQNNLDKHNQVIENAIKGEESLDYETDLISLDGNVLRFLFSIDIIKDQSEKKGILFKGKDITQRQRAWDELVKLEEKYRVLAETSADGVVTVDPLGRLTYVNPSFEKLLGRRKSKILATLFRDYLSENSVYFFQQVFIDARKKDEKIENVDLEVVDLNEKILPIEVNIAPYKKNDEFAGMVLTIRDVTERRRIENELKKSERLKTEFMNIAAHELKSPVTPIKGYLELIISDKTTNEQIKNWGRISLRNAERLLKLVNDILDVSRLDTDTMRFEMEKINTVDILNEVVEDMRPAVEKKNLKFNHKIPTDLPEIMGDKHRLAQVLKNLLVNAIKFTDHGFISVEAEKKKDHILISVKDSGLGISSDELKKIFNKFYQCYTGDDRRNEGTGLGLFICKEILQKHNAKIYAESQLGKGSQFYIELPYLHKMIVNLNN